MDILSSLAAEQYTDKMAHGYLPHYRVHLPSPHESFSLLEIGVFEGNSLRLWQRYFPHAHIYGVDVESKYIFQDKRITTWLGNATLTEFWADKEIPNLQVVIDDGSHQAEDIVAAWEILWPRLPSGGLYVIEDLAVQYMPHYGGGTTGSPATSLIQGIMDGILSPLLRPAQNEMHIYNEIVFVKKA